MNTLLAIIVLSVKYVTKCAIRRNWTCIKSIIWWIKSRQFTRVLDVPVNSLLKVRFVITLDGIFWRISVKTRLTVWRSESVSFVACNFLPIQVCVFSFQSFNIFCSLHRVSEFDEIYLVLPERSCQPENGLSLCSIGHEQLQETQRDGWSSQSHANSIPRKPV